MPLVASLLQRRDGSRPVLLGQPDLAASEVHRRVERCSASITDLVLIDDAVALVRCRASRLEVAGRDRDLDLSRKTPEAEERLGRFVERARDPCDGGVDLAFGKPEQ